jgi:glutamate-1-semialdehyde 2,1-aminomutase
MIGVTPHLSAFGKAMANGFSVSALVGQKEFMKLGGITHDEERVFLLSTTHGGETHALAASIASINEIKKHNAIEHFWNIGKLLKDGIRAAALEVSAEKYINVSGYDVKPAFSFNDENGEISMIARTLFLQETVSQGLMMPYVVPSFSHKKDDIVFAVECVKNALIVMKNSAENGGMASAIRGEIVKPVFRKFN